MRNRDQVIYDFVQGWLAKAERDIQAAEVLLASPNALNEAIGFHAQQAAEKFVKAYLVRHQVEFPKTHDLTALRKLVGDADECLAEQLTVADWLTQFAVQLRYPGEITQADHHTASRALADAKRTRQLVLDALKGYLQHGRPE